MANHNSTTKLVFRALESRNYLLFFIGQGISLIGTWFQFTAMSWLVYRLTKSAFLLGAVGFVGQFPPCLLTPFAGVMADRVNRRNILIITQILYTIQSLILAILVLTKVVTIWHVMILSLFAGVISTFDMTARQSFVVDMVDKKEYLGNAIALNSSLFNLARLIGPSIAGLLINAAGEGICFLLNSISFLAIIVALFAMRINPKIQGKQKLDVFKGIKDGFKYVSGSLPIKASLLLTGLVSLMGMTYGVLMPVFAKEIFQGGPHTLGFLMSAAGCGALLGALTIASKEDVTGLEKLIPIGVFICGLGLVGFSFSSNLYIAMALLFLTGYGLLIFFTTSNTLIQTLVEEDKRGRVMSLYTMSFMGTMPIGSLLCGTLASRIGAPETVLICGLFCMAGAVLFKLKVKSSLQKK